MKDPSDWELSISCLTKHCCGSFFGGDGNFFNNALVLFTTDCTSAEEGCPPKCPFTNNEMTVQIQVDPIGELENLFDDVNMTQLIEEMEEQESCASPNNIVSECIIGICVIIIIICVWLGPTSFDGIYCNVLVSL